MGACVSVSQGAGASCLHIAARHPRRHVRQASTTCAQLKPISHVYGPSVHTMNSGTRGGAISFGWLAITRQGIPSNNPDSVASGTREVERFTYQDPRGGQSGMPNSHVWRDSGGDNATAVLAVFLLFSSCVVIFQNFPCPRFSK